MNKSFNFHHFFFRWNGFVFSVVTLLILLPSDILKLACLFVWIFICAINHINHVKMYPMSWNLDMFFMNIIFVHTPKFVIVWKIPFTGPHLNLFFISLFRSLLLLNECSSSISFFSFHFPFVDKVSFLRR